MCRLVPTNNTFTRSQGWQSGTPRRIEQDKTGDENNKDLIKKRKEKRPKLKLEHICIIGKQASATPSQLQYIGVPTLPLAPSATFVLALEMESLMQSGNCSNATVKLLVPVQDVEAGLCGGARPLPSVSVYNPAAVLLRQ